MDHKMEEVKVTKTDLENGKAEIKVAVPYFLVESEQQVVDILLGAGMPGLRVTINGTFHVKSGTIAREDNFLDGIYTYIWRGPSDGVAEH